MTTTKGNLTGGLATPTTGSTVAQPATSTFATSVANTFGAPAANATSNLVTSITDASGNAPKPFVAPHASVSPTMIADTGISAPNINGDWRAMQGWNQVGTAGGPNANAALFSRTQDGKTAYYMPSSFDLNEGIQKVDPSQVAGAGGIPLKDSSGHIVGYTFASDPTANLTADKTGFGHVGYTPGMKGGQDLKQFATAAAIAASMFGGAFLAPAAAGALGAGATGVSGAAVGGGVGGALGGISANANTNAEADPLGTLKGGVTGAVLGGVTGGVGGELFGGAAPSAADSAASMPGGDYMSQLTYANAGSGAAGDLSGAAGSVPSGGGMFPGGMIGGGQPIDSFALPASDVSIGGTGPTYASTAANASPMGFGSAAPGSEELAAAASPGGITGAGAGAGAPVDNLFQNMPTNYSGPASPTGVDASTVYTPPSSGGLGGVGDFLSANPNLAKAGVGALVGLIGQGIAPKNTKPPAPTINTQGVQNSLTSGATTSLVGQANKLYSTPFAPGNYGADMQAAIDAASKQFHALNDPVFGLQTQRLENQLQNQGIQRGSEAWNNAFTDLTSQQDKLISASNAQAVTAGQAEQEKLFLQALSQYELPASTINSLIGTSQMGAPQLYGQQTNTSNYNAQQMLQKQNLLGGLAQQGLLAAVK